ncbi:HugZ family pyridoxamine 5'-phosphate oxidase [Nocardia aurantia]|uniref:Pyridoxamine 5'-phosphate oxidase n=1 Tax=Nocardia aurantia TaxID=2585199 RepID=A0A7K0DXQ1_9NOCA|nr:DUF2470 domain-containing protein [Nocardia aurantia]MQY30495.1 hypothetical protein [Nocardia aurantia]
MASDHGRPSRSPATPLTAVANDARPSPAEEARTVAASTNTATLATLTGEGDPWASFVTFGLLDGQPVLCLSRMAEHGRNLEADPRASLAIVAPDRPADPLAAARVTLAGIVQRPQGGEVAAARQAHLEAVPAAEIYIDFTDFTLWVLRVQRVRWVGGYGRMDSATAEDYAGAGADPITPTAGRAVAHLNDDHADALLDMARALGGYPDATAAVCDRADRYGLDLRVETPRGPAATRVGYATPLTSADELRSATVELTRLARGR